MWPRIPRWYFGLWALLGVRNPYQKEMNWKQVKQGNSKYCEEGLSYMSNRKLLKLVQSNFSKARYCGDYLMQNHPSNKIQIISRMPILKNILAFILMNFRTALLYAQK